MSYSLKYGCQVGAVLKNYDFYEGLDEYLKLAQKIELKSVELDFHTRLYS